MPRSKVQAEIAAPVEPVVAPKSARGKAKPIVAEVPAKSVAVKTGKPAAVPIAPVPIASVPDAAVAADAVRRESDGKAKEPVAKDAKKTVRTASKPAVAETPEKAKPAKVASAPAAFGPIEAAPKAAIEGAVPVAAPVVATPPRGPAPLPNPRLKTGNVFTMPPSRRGFAAPGQADLGRGDARGSVVPLAGRGSGVLEEFAEGDHVVYPTHGVGKVERIAIEDIAGHRLELIHITFEENRMTLRVPVAKARSAGLRKLATRKAFDDALAVLRGRARIKRTMWSRRAQEYEAKINSGDPASIAEVVRDLHRNAGQPDQSFSERQIYEAAMDRLAAELAALDRTDKATAAIKLAEFLKTLIDV